MPLFGKPRITEAEAASEFVLMMLTRISVMWQSIVQNLQSIFELEGIDGGDFSDSVAQYEFCLAAITMQMQALKNLVGGSAEERIRRHIFVCLQPDELGSHPNQAIAEYERAWSGALEAHAAPHEALAATLAARLGLNITLRMGDAELYRPIALSALGAQLVNLGGIPWWKELTAKYKLR